MGINYVLVREYKKLPAFVGYYICEHVNVIERCLNDAMYRFIKAKKDDPIMTAANLFGNNININPFEDATRKIFHLILDIVLMQMKCSPFPVQLIYSSK